jgi:16S rRNA (cytidine1402-2'-O)-methyltransferase
LESGTLYIIATPIGNMGDISHRAVSTLKSVNAILAEDTRVSHFLLSHWGITSRVTSYHDFNKEKVTPAIIDRLTKGENLAVISDAGTPGIADEAFFLVREAIKAGIKVCPLPGASSLISALTCSGLPCDRFIFENFIPVKSGRRRAFLESLKDEKRTVVFFESPYRILRTLADIKDVLGEIPVVVARELTKIHEEFIRGTPTSVLNRFSKSTPRGEMVVMINTTAKSLQCS